MGRASQESTFNEVKALNAVTFIASLLKRDCGKHGVLKTLYFAERTHLAKYGRTICGDRLIKMQYGPVASKVSDMLDAEKDNNEFLKMKANPFFIVKGNKVIAVAEPDLDVFSDSEIDCLEEAIEETNDLSFGQRSDKSHDSAWKAATMNREMDLLKVAEAGGADHNMLKYIQQVFDYKPFIPKR